MTDESARGNRYAQGDKDHAMWLHSRGYSYSEIAKEIGCDRNTVGKWARLRGKRRKTGRKPKVDPEEALALYGEWGTLQSVAQILQVASSTAYRAIAIAREARGMRSPFRPWRRVVESHVMGGDTPRRTHWWNLVLECGHDVERTVRYKPCPENKDKRDLHRRSLRDALMPCFRVRCEKCPKDTDDA